MAQRITIDLTKNPETADVVADLEVGDAVEVNTTIVSKDDQTLVLEVEEVVVGDEGTETPDAMEGGEEPVTDVSEEV